MMWRLHKADPTEAIASRERAERDLERRQADGARVSAMTDEWRRIRERNNFAAAFRHSIRGGQA